METAGFLSGAGVKMGVDGVGEVRNDPALLGDVVGGNAAGTRCGGGDCGGLKLSLIGDTMTCPGERASRGGSFKRGRDRERDFRVCSCLGTCKYCVAGMVATCNIEALVLKVERL